jgi:hypothetical protein
VGDADGDGDVDGRDYLRWQRGYASPAAQVVAETSTLALVVLPLAALAVRVRARRLIAGRQKSRRKALKALATPCQKGLESVLAKGFS